MATTVVSSPSTVAVPSNFLGLHIGLNIPFGKPNQTDPIESATVSYDVVRTLKMEVDGISEAGFWSNIETSEGVYDWSLVDQWMTETSPAKVIWLVYGTPTFYQKYPGETSRWPSWPGIQSPPADAHYDKLTNFVQAVKARDVSTWGNRIIAFEIWNEPTLPWDGGNTSYNDRWSTSWGTTNSPSSPYPFFSGSASDLANVAYTLSNASLGVPILGAGFVDQWDTDKNTVERFLNAPVTLSGGTGTGKDYIDAFSMHWYDYNKNVLDLIDAYTGYVSKLTSAGVGSLDIWLTEMGAEGSGVFGATDTDAPGRIANWVLTAAALGVITCCLYAWASEPTSTDNLGNLRNRNDVRLAINKVYTIHGKTITSAVLDDFNNITVRTTDNTNYVVFDEGLTMTAPAVVQSKIGINQSFGPGAATLNMDSNVTAGNAVIAGAVIYNPNYSSGSLLAGVTENGTSLSANATTNFLYEANKALSIFTLKTATGGGTAVAFTPGVADSSNQATLFAIELDSNIISTGTWASNFVGTNSGNGVASLTAGPTGTLPTGDIRLFAVVSNNNYSTETDIGWIVPSGWTEVAKQSDGSTGKYTLQIITKTVSVTTSESVVTDSTIDDLVGRVAIIFAISGSASGGTTKKVKLLGNASAIGQTSIDVEVFEVPSGSGNEIKTGAKIFGITGQAFESVANASGQAEMYITAPVQGDVTTGQNVVAIGVKSDNSAGWQGTITGVVVEN